MTLPNDSNVGGRPKRTNVTARNNKDTSYKRKATGKKKTDKDIIVTEALALPEVINHTACWKAYHLEETACVQHIPPNPKVKNCKNNPYCIHRLGLEKLEKALKDQPRDSQSATLTKRDIEQQPCGLLNYGNFCYVNSFLQIWFNDLPFRQCIYNWPAHVPFTKPDTAKMDIQAVMNCIQELFVRMQITPFETTNALELTELLKLDNEQHDVQEFTILFFDALDRNLESHPHGHLVRNFIRKRFEGCIEQSVECPCGRRSVTSSVFRSLQLIIENFKSLTKAIENYFKEEELSDYKCDQCNKRGNVVRKSTAVELPPVLMIQLNRYVFDQNGQNKKLKTAIQYPRVLPERALNPHSEENRDYELCAVMIHEGQNTYCGHYYDLIKDPVANQWFTYNDKEVAQTKAPGVSVEKDAINRATNDMKGCYALIYRRAEPNDPTSVAELKLPPAPIVRQIETKVISFSVRLTLVLSCLAQ
jgi:uncharacterized UBP type Zn finger protein